MTAAEAKRRLETLIGTMETAMVDAIDETADEYLVLQKDQFKEGQRRDGTFLPPYSEPYARKRQAHGLQTEVKDLNFTGQYYGQMILEAYADVLNITSDVDYEQWIDYHYNQDGELYGLNDDNLDQYRRAAFWPAFREKITEETALTFQ